MAIAKTSTKRKKKVKRNIASGQIHVKATFNNTIISVTDDKGNVLAWATAGSSGFKGSRKSTPYAAGIAAEKVATAAKDFGMQKVDVLLQGVGSGRESAVRSLANVGLEVASIKDVTGIPHNGCRPKKPRKQ